MNTVSVPLIVMAAVTFYVSFYHLMIYFRGSQQREHLTFALTCLVWGFYDVFCANLYSVASVAEGAYWQRWQGIALDLAGVAFLWFMSDYTSQISKRTRYIFSAYCALDAIVAIVERSGLKWMLDQPSTKEVQVFGLQATYYEATPGPLQDLQSLVGLVLMIYLLWVTVRFHRSGHRERAVPMLLALGVFFASVFNDTAVSTGAYRFIYTMEYAYMGMVLVMTYSLSSSILEAAVVKEALRESEKRYRNIFETTAVSIWEEDFAVVKAATNDLKAQGVTDFRAYLDEHPEFVLQAVQMVKVVDVNDTTLKMFKAASKGELLGSLDKVFVPETLQIFGEEIIAMAEGRAYFEGETINRTLQGEHLNILVTVSIPSEAERFGSVLVSIIDITKRVRAEAEILRLQRLLQSITDSMPSALITLDPAGRVLNWNPATEALTGQVADQVQGQLLWQACPELVRYRELFEHVLQEGRVTHWHKEQLATGAGVVYRDVSAFPLLADSIEGVVLRIDDVTQRVQMEEMMLQSAKMASIGGLAAGVAHEINNPLGAMMQSAQVLQMAFDTQRPRIRERLQAYGVDPEGLGCYLRERGLTDYLTGIRSTGERAAKIVSDLLSFSRKSSSKTASHDLNTLVERTLELAATDYDLKKKYDFRDIEIVRELALELPEVVCDGRQIQQVVLNLVRNAAQAMAAERSEWRMANGEYRPRLTLRTAYREEIRDPKSAIRNRVVRLEVEDNGPGIPEAVRARLFEPFFTTKDVSEGTGLGLWLCWSIVVERHKGRIWTESVPGGGTRFVVELPVASPS